MSDQATIRAVISAMPAAASGFSPALSLAMPYFGGEPAQ
jgi:hypothetical protein